MKNFKSIASIILIILCLTTISFAKDIHLNAKVLKISDGDTIWVRLENGNKIKVRIWGIDTPEKFGSKKLYKTANRCGVEPSAIVHLGKLASKQARKLLDHSRIELIPKGRGYYGRLLGIIVLPNGKDFGKTMIETGYACIYRRSAPPEYRKGLRKAEKNRSGLWDLNPQLMKCICVEK